MEGHGEPLTAAVVLGKMVKAPRLTTDTYRALYLRDTFWVYQAFNKGTALLCTGGG